MVGDLLKVICTFVLVLVVVYLYTTLRGGPFLPVFTWIGQFLPDRVDVAIRMPGY